MTLLVEPKSVQHGARAAIRRGKVHHYNDAEKVGYQNHIILESKHHAPRIPFKEPLVVEYLFLLPRAKSNEDIFPHRIKPDVLNLAKHTEDALTKAGFWVDDKQVIDMSIRKRFVEPGLPPRIEITIKTVTP